MKYLNKLKSNLTEKEQNLYIHFYKRFDQVIENVLGINRDILLAKFEISKTVSERYADSVMLSKSHLVVNDDYIRGLLSEIGDLFTSYLDLMYNNRYLEEDDDDYEEDEPTMVLYRYTGKAEEFYTTVLYIFFNRILPQPYTQEVKRSFMDISDVEFERIYRSKTKNLNSERRKFKFIMAELEKNNLLEVIRYYNKNYEKIINQLKETITIEDIIDLTSEMDLESEEKFKEKISFSQNIFDSFHKKLISKIKKGLPIIRKPFESEIYYKEGTIITIRNALTGDNLSTELFKNNIDIVFKALEKEKLDKVTYGLTIVFDTQSPYSSYITKFGGAYFPLDEDDVRLRHSDKVGTKTKLEKEMIVANSVIISPVGNSDHTIAHEIGHRFYYVFLSDKKRARFDGILEPIRLDMNSLYQVGKLINMFFTERKKYLNKVFHQLDTTETKQGTIVDIGSSEFARIVQQITKTTISPKIIKASIQSIFRSEFIFGHGDYGRMYIMKFPITTIISQTEPVGINKSIKKQQLMGYDPLWAENISSSAYAETYLMAGDRSAYKSEAFAELFATYVLHKNQLTKEQFSLIRNALVDVDKQVSDSVDQIENEYVDFQKIK